MSLAPILDPTMTGQLSYERVEGDFYPTPPENVDCLAHFIDLQPRFIWEPACGEGHISKRLAQYSAGVFSTDLYDRGYGKSGVNFLKASKLAGNSANRACSIVTNPPFGNEAEKFIRHALELTEKENGMVAMFMRNEYDMAVGRMDLFEKHPAYSMKICVTKRPRWFEGSKGSPRHNYSWYVWDWQDIRLPGTGAEVRYIHPKDAIPFGHKES